MNHIARSTVARIVMVTFLPPKGRSITVELTRRRESKDPSLPRASYETRSRRLRPTTCWAATHHEARSSFFQVAKSSTGVGSRPANHSAHLPGENLGSSHSITQVKNSRGPPFMYGGGETGLKTVGKRSSSET